MKRRTRSVAEFNFRNVDLQVVSKDDLGPFVTAFGRTVFVLGNSRWRGRHWVNLEVARIRPKDPNQVIKEFVRLLDDLPPKVRRLWAKAKERTFNVGVVSSLKVRSVGVYLEADVVNSIARLGGRVVVTIYSPGVRK